MSYRRVIIGSTVATAVLAGVAVLAASRLPPGAQLPIHWNAAGEADRMADAGTALALPVLISAAMAAMLAVLPRIEPMQRDLEGSRPLFLTAWAGVLAIAALIEAIVAAPAFGYQLPPTLSLVAVGVMLIAVGNMLPKSRPGFFVGIRTPWALIDTDNWIATHRVGARWMTGAGMAVTAAALLPVPAQVRAAMVTVAIGIAVVVPVAYSFLHWRRGPGRGGAAG